MTRTQVLREIRRMRFEEVYGGWQERRLTQEEAARLPGVYEPHVPALRGPLRGRRAWTALVVGTGTRLHRHHPPPRPLPRTGVPSRAPRSRLRSTTRDVYRHEAKHPFARINACSCNLAPGPLRSRWQQSPFLSKARCWEPAPQNPSGRYRWEMILKERREIRSCGSLIPILARFCPCGGGNPSPSFSAAQAPGRGPCGLPPRGAAMSKATHDPAHPGASIRAEVEATGWTAGEAAKRSGVTGRALSAVTNGRAKVSAGMAPAPEALGWAEADFRVRRPHPCRPAQARLRRAASRRPSPIPGAQTR